MYCQQQFSYPADYQQYSTNPYGLPTGAVANYGNISPYSPNGDRPSPSFRIEDILLQNKNGHTASMGTYPLPYTNGAPSPTGLHSPIHYRLPHSVAHAAGHGTSHFQHQPSIPGIHGCTTPYGTIGEKEHQGPSPAVLSSLPVYFRLKPTLRTASGRKCRKPRTVFSELQLMVLEREFTEHKYLSTPQRTKLAERLGLNQTQIKTWFQNRRMKWKKETTEKERKEGKIGSERLIMDEGNGIDDDDKLSDTCESN